MNGIEKQLRLEKGKERPRVRMANLGDMRGFTYSVKLWLANDSLENTECFGRGELTNLENLVSERS